MHLFSVAPTAKNPPLKRTLKLVAPWKHDWKHIFNPQHGRRSELVIDLNLLQGSASLDALKQALSDNDSIDIEFETKGVWLKPNFNHCFITDQIDPKEAQIKIPQHGARLLPYGTHWTLYLSESLAYQIAVICDSPPASH